MIPEACLEVRVKYADDMSARVHQKGYSGTDACLSLISCLTPHLMSASYDTHSDEQARGVEPTQFRPMHFLSRLPQWICD